MKALIGRIGRRTRIAIGVGIVVIAVLALALSGRGRSEANSMFQTTPLTRGELTASVGATGTVRAAQSAVLNWQAPGTVESVGADVGDAVRKDRILASLAMDSVPQTVIQAQANVISAQRALEDARSMTGSAEAAIALREAQEAYKKAYNYRLSLNGKQWIQDVRIRYVHGQQVPEITWHKGFVDQGTIEKAEETLALRKAELDDAQRAHDRLQDGPNPDDVAAAQANLDAAQAILNTAHIISPIDGTVTQAYPVVGDHVEAGRPAFRVDDLENLLVDVEVSEIDINSIGAGQPVELTLDAIANTTYHGQVTQVSQAGDTSSGSVVFAVTVRVTDADGSVKPGMTAAVNIIVNQLADQLLVPNRAVRLIEGQRVVYVLREGRAVPVDITLGASSDTMSVLAEGELAEGELIILNPPTFNGGPFGGGPG